MRTGTCFKIEDYRASFSKVWLGMTCVESTVSVRPSSRDASGRRHEVPKGHLEPTFNSIIYFAQVWNYSKSEGKVPDPLRAHLAIQPMLEQGYKCSPPIPPQFLQITSLSIPLIKAEGLALKESSHGGPRTVRREWAFAGGKCQGPGSSAPGASPSRRYPLQVCEAGQCSKW